MISRCGTSVDDGNNDGAVAIAITVVTSASKYINSCVLEAFEGEQVKVCL